VPFYLVFVGLAVDIARRLRILEPPVGAAAGTALGYGALLAQDALLETPPTAYWTAHDHLWRACCRVVVRHMWSI
jgi:hypothetical protein